VALEVHVASKLLVFRQPFVWNHVETTKCLWQGGFCIVFPVGHTVAHHKTFQVNHWQSSVTFDIIHYFSLEVKLINLPRKVWDVDAAIALSRDEQTIVEVLWEPVVPLQQSLDGVEGLSVVTLIERLFANADGETDVSRLFEEEHVGSFVPREFVVFELLVAVDVDYQWTIFLEHSQE